MGFQAWLGAFGRRLGGRAARLPPPREPRAPGRLPDTPRRRRLTGRRLSSDPPAHPPGPPPPPTGGEGGAARTDCFTRSVETSVGPGGGFALSPRPPPPGAPRH